MRARLLPGIVLLALLPVIPLPLGAEDSPAAQFQRLVAEAGTADRAGDLPAATRLLEEARALLPAAPAAAAAHIDMALLLCRLYMAQGRYGAALATTRPAWDMTAEGAPKRRALALAHGKALAAMGRRDEARAILTDGMNPPAGTAEDVDFALTLAALYLQERDSTALSQLLDRWRTRIAAEAGPDQLRLIEGRLALQAGQFDTAAAAFDAVLASADPRDRAAARYALGDLALLAGDFPQAETRFLQAQVGFEQLWGMDHPSVGLTIHARALLRSHIGDIAAAARFFDEAEARLTEALGADHPSTLAVRVERVHLHLRNDDAATASREAGALVQQFHAAGLAGSYEFRLATAAVGLAAAAGGDAAGAVAALSQLAPGAPLALQDQDRPPGLIALGRIAMAQGDPATAAGHLQQAVAILLRFPGFGADLLGEGRRLLAEAALQQGQTALAADLIELNTTALRDSLLNRPASALLSMRVQPRSLRPILAQTLRLRLDQWQQTGDPAPLFEAMQLLHLDDLALAMPASALASDAGPEARALLAEREAVLRDLARDERRLTDRSAFTGADDRQQTIARLLGLDERLTALNLRIAAEGIGRRRLVPLPELQAVLGPGEGFWMQAAFDDFALGIIVTQKGVTLAPLADETTLEPLIAELRASVTLREGEALPPFATDAARQTHSALFGPFQDALDGATRLILMPDGAARRMSPAILVTNSDGPPQYLGATHALVQAPSVEAFLSARRNPGARGLSQGFVGLAEADLASPGVPLLQTALYDPATGLGDPQAIRAGLPYLADTATEMRLIADRLAPGQARILARSEASETALRHTDFSDVSVLSLASHALVSGEGGLPEPAIVLTPPAQAREEDDGLLMASEIALMDLPVRLVVLSACNTAGAAGRIGASGLSGLAAAFLRAGAGGVLATHWAIDSGPSALIVAQFVTAAMRTPDAGAARPAPGDVLRDIRAFLVRQDDPVASHPATWGAFVLVADR